MRKIMLAFAVSALPLCAALADEELPGTYKLISGTRTIVETGEIKDAYGKQPKGYIIYGRDGRMLEQFPTGPNRGGSAE
jgi:lipocalin-like protein